MSNAETTFIGIDLAWQTDKNNSAIAVARGDAKGAVLVELSEPINKTADVAECVLYHATENTVVAIDAPLVITNETGQRPCETAVSKRFWKQHAGAHTTNLKLYPDAGSVQLAQLLEQQDFRHVVDPTLAKYGKGRWFFEVYPHPAQVALFDLPLIIKYKKRRVAKRRKELGRLQGYLNDLKAADPPLNAEGSELLRRDVDALRGKSLKWHEDQLDAYFCAYLALFYWRWGAEKNEVFGDLETGYIVVPTAALSPSENNLIHTFNLAFERWGIRLPADAVEQITVGRIQDAGWSIRYRFGRDDQGAYLDYYAAHRMTDDRHVRLRISGKNESLPALQSFRLLSRNPEEDARLAAEYKTENQKVAEMLSAKGLF